MTDTPRALDYMPLTDLVERLDPDNVKGHDDDGIDASVDRFGYTEPVMVDERTGRLVAGHGRVAALRRYQETHQRPPEGVIIVGDDWSLPVIRGWASSDDDEARAYMVAANRLTEKGGWTNDLGPLLAELADTDAGLPPGFDQDDLDTLLAELGNGELPGQDTEAAHADDMSSRGEPAAPREVQGLHEVGLMFQAEAHAEYLAVVSELRRRWGGDMASPMIVLRALRIVRDQDE